MAEKSILVLGAGVMQIPALETARKNGWYLIVADGNPGALGRDLADAFHTVDLKDTDGLLTLARRYRERGRLDGVFTAGTDFSASVAYVAEALDLPGLSYQTALNATDKSRMRRLFAEQGVSSPGHREVASVSALDERNMPPFPLVVKPVDNMGARGVRRVDGLQELRGAVAAALEFSRSGRVIVEEFIEGPEFSIDALIVDGELTVCGIADRHIMFSPYFIEVGHTMPTRLGESEQAEIGRALGHAARALGIRNGAAKGDIFLTHRGAVVGEVAARLSGGYMSGWTYPYASGVPLTEAAMRLSLGLDPGNLAPRYHHTSAERASISIPGVVSEVLGFETARARPAVRELFERAAPGDEVTFPRNNTEKCANVIAAAAGRAEAVGEAENAVGDIVVRLEAAHPATRAFLEGTDTPQALELRKDENRNALAAMPAGDARPGLRRYRPLPAPGDEGGRDWNYRSLSRTLEMLTDIAGIRPASDGPAHGRRFWEYLLKGGLQGALFYLDTVDRDSTFLE